MPALLAHPVFHYPNEDLFSLMIKHQRLQTVITMELAIPFVSTKDFPATVSVLKRRLPSILKSQCFNDENLPFLHEVRATEIGHLFEHILLEYLCMLKLLKGSSDVTFSGTTNWNWYRDPRGMFHIRVNAGFTEADIFPEALERSITLLQEILQGKPSQSN